MRADMNQVQIRRRYDADRALNLNWTFKYTMKCLATALGFTLV